MQHWIAFNGFRGGNKGSASCQPLSAYDKTISLPWLHEMVLQIRGEKSIRSVDRTDDAQLAKARQRIKGQLPFRCAHYYRFLKNRRSQSNADPTAFLFQTTVDVDDKEFVEQALEKARELNCSDSIWKGMLLHLEYSAKNKLHIDIRMPIGMTIEETQKAYCEALGVPYDESCISPERMIYITDKDSEIYRSKDWYGVLPAEELKARREAFLKRGLTIDGKGTARYSLLAGDCKSPERLAGDFLSGQNGYSLLAGDDYKSPGRLAGANLNVQSSSASYPPPPPMPKKLPKLVKLLISKTPEIYQPAVAHAIFPPLATHLWNTRFRYIDNVEHEATLMTCLLAGTGAGKSCVQMPISMIMEDIRKRDQENLKREKEWKEEMMRKGANKDKRKRPDNLIIQEIDADMTNPAFVMRTAEAKGHFLYTSLNEIDQFDALKGIGNQHFRIMCLAFDPGNQYGQTRVGTQSVTERVTVRFNWNASTTIQKGQRYFSKVLTDGPLSRINFCTIPEREIGDKIPVYGTYDDQFRKELKPYIENLCMATGLIDCPEAYRLAEILSEENADFSQVTQNRIYENFTFRANVIAYLKACVLYVANGCRWEPEIEDFIRWSERYDLWCKMRFFEEDIQKANHVGEHSNKRGPSNLLQSLPDTFTEQQVVEARAALGLSEEGTAHLLSTWVYRKYVKRGSENYHSNSYHSFTKLKYRCDGQELS